jgi:23S rRNA (guanosine2251-2'-O)-methyltransferase
MQLFGKKALMDSLQKPQTIVVVNILHDINLENLLQKHNVKFNIKDKNYFKQFDEKLNHQNVVLEVVNNEKYDDIEKFLNENKNEVSILLIIDSIQDPQNFGSIIRTCEAFGVDGIIYKKNSQVQVNDLVVKASTGAIKNVNMFPVVNLSSTVELLKKHNY